jgi:hypothetical protein
MNDSMLIRTGGAVLGGIVAWIIFRFEHKAATRPSELFGAFDPRHLVVRVPWWLSLFCGRPLKDSQVEVGAMFGQIGAFMAILFWLLGVWLRIDMYLMIVIYLGVGGGMPLVGYALVKILNRGRDKKKK